MTGKIANIANGLTTNTTQDMQNIVVLYLGMSVLNNARYHLNTKSNKKSRPPGGTGKAASKNYHFYYTKQEGKVNGKSF